MSTCACGSDWIIYSCDLKTGRIRAVLHPLSFDFEDRLNNYGPGSLMLATKDVRIRDIWPHLTSVYFARVSGPGATPTEPVVEWGGLIEMVEASDTGTTTVGLKAIEGYAEHRSIRDDLSWPNNGLTEVAAGLITYIQPNGIPLTAEWTPSFRSNRQRNYKAYNRKYVGEAITDLTQVIDGPDWETVHTKTGGSFSTQMIFRDYVGVDRDIILQSDREAQGYNLIVDAKDHATLVDAIGSGEEEDMLIASVQDPADIYPEFDATPAWKDVTQSGTLYEHAYGYLTDYQEPFATPQVSVFGLEPSPLLLRKGDTIGVAVNFGAVTYNGRARIIGVSWSAGVGNPISRTFELVPLTRASESVLNQQPTDNCPEC